MCLETPLARKTTALVDNIVLAKISAEISEWSGIDKNRCKGKKQEELLDDDAGGKQANSYLEEKMNTNGSLFSVNIHHSLHTDFLDKLLHTHVPVQ